METKNQNKIVTAPSLENTQELYEIYLVANPIAFEVKTSGEAEIEIRLRVGAQEVFSASLSLIHI